MTESDDRQKWNGRYRNTDIDYKHLSPAQVLLDYQHLLPIQGEALDCACGLGVNALFLAQRGLSVTAWDISDVAIANLQQTARTMFKNASTIRAETHDVLLQPPAAQQFDLVVVSRFLERSLFPLLIQALKPGGMLYYQTFIKDKTDDVGPSNPDYLLDENELLALCEGLQIVVYREEGNVSSAVASDSGSQSVYHNEAMVVARRRCK